MDDEIMTSAELMEAAALPCSRAVHADPNTTATPEQLPLPEAVVPQADQPEKPCRMGL